MAFLEQLFVVSSEADRARFFSRVEHMSMHSKSLFWNHAVFVQLVHQVHLNIILDALRHAKAEVTLADGRPEGFCLVNSKEDKVSSANCLVYVKASIHAVVSPGRFYLHQVCHEHRVKVFDFKSFIFAADWGI